MPNFSIALTGLQADTIALNTIGNNLANLNTTAFKKQTTTFEDLFYQKIGTDGSGATLQVGAGTKVSGTSSDFKQGDTSPTQSPTDMALGGTGFFLVQRGNDQALTRAGNFQLDVRGDLITSSGESVMGYGVKNGDVNLTGGLIPLQLPLNTTEGAQPTKNLALTVSLDATAPTGSQYTSSPLLFDSVGKSHQATVTYTKASPTTWDYTIALPPGESTGTPVNNTGTLTFDSAGTMVSPAANVSGVSFPGMVDGASDLTFNFNLHDASGAPTFTQAAGQSNTAALSQDGFAAGIYQSFSVDANGIVSASFSNNHTAKVGQVAIASVNNEGGLVRTGGNDYAATDASGVISVGVANVGGRGAIVGQALELSNVDIAAEFSDLIVAQRAFEANSKTVTVFDSVTQQAIGMIR